MSQSRPPITLRVATPEDLKFVRNSWSESYRKGGFAPEVDFPTYRKGQGALIDRLARSEHVIIAYATAVPDEIVGWVCGQNEIIHFVYVKHAYRRMGIATQLAEGGKEHTHETRAGRRLFAKLKSRFNPYVLHHVNPQGYF